MSLDTTNARDFALPLFQSNMTRRTELGREQHLLQVFAVQSARIKILARGIRNTALNELQEFQWRTRIRRHATRRHVEQIRESAFGIGHTATYDLRTFDQNQARGLSRRTTQQIGRQHGATEAASDDDDRAQ